MYIGYLRVSTIEQNLERQQHEMNTWLDEHNIPATERKFYEEKASGKDTNRPAFQAMLEFAREGDTVLLSELSRLGRDYDDIKNTVQLLQQKGVKIIILDAPFLKFDTGNKVMDKAMFDMFLSLLAYISDNERKKLLERQKAGIAVAKSKGVYKGGKPRYSAKATGKNKLVFDTVVAGLDAGEPITHIANRAGITRQAVYDIKKRLSDKEE